MASSATGPPALRILMLHGFTQSGPLFRSKTRFLETSLRKAFPPSSLPPPYQNGAGVELVYLTAPHRLQLPDQPGSIDLQNDPETAPQEGKDSESYGWWRKDDDTNHYVGIEDTFSLLADTLSIQGPFAGAIGFSQGAGAAALLASLLERPGRVSAFSAAHSSNPEALPYPAAFQSLVHPRLKFAISYSGFVAQDKRVAAAFDPVIETPILHFLGSLDGVVDEGRSLALVKANVGGERRVVYHPGGHFVPGGKQFVGAVVGFIRECLKNGEGDGKQKSWPENGNL